MKARTLLLVALVSVVCLTSFAAADQDTADVCIADTVRLGCPVQCSAVVVGDSLPIPVYIWHDEWMGGFTLGFSYDYDYVVIESIDLTGSVLDELQRSTIKELHDPENRRSLIGWIAYHPTLWKVPSAGDAADLIFTLNMRVLKGATPCWIDIDSTWVAPAGYFILSIDSDTSAEQLVRQITPLYHDCYNPNDTDSADVALNVVEVERPTLPEEFSLAQNFPNPFNAGTFIEFALPRSAEVKLEVFNVVGQRVRTLVDRRLKAGHKRVEWDGADDRGDPAASGVYFYRLTADQFAETKKMLMLK